MILLEPHDVEVFITVAVKHLCPFTEETDDDLVEISYDGNQGLLEAHSLVEHLDTFNEVKITSEALAVRVHEDLMRVGILAVVKVAGEHAGGRVFLGVTAR